MDFLLYLAKFLFFTLLSEYLRPKVQREKPAAAGLKDLNFPTVDQTRPHQWLMGTQLVDNPNLFATFDFQSQERTKRVRTGLIRRETIVVGHDYYVGFAMVLCGGSGARLRRIWAGDRLIWEGNITSGTRVPVNIEWFEEGQPDAPRGFKGIVEFYSGPSSPTFTPRSNYLIDKRGTDNVPNWKHVTYVVLRGLRDSDVTSGFIPSALVQALTAGGIKRGMWIGTSTQVEHLKFELERMPSAASTGIGAPADGGNYWAIGQDANPAYAIAEVMTDTKYCAGIAVEELDAASFHRAAKVLFEENHGTSQLWDSQRSSGEVVLELCRQIGGVIQPDPLTGLHTMRLLRAADEPVLTLNDDNIKVLSQFSQNSMDEATNSLALTYADRSDKFKRKPVEVLDDAAIEIAGKVIPGTASYAGITNGDLANIVATRDLRSLSSPLATARLTAIVPKRQRFLPGDVVLLSSMKNGITGLRMRVTSARYSKPGEALCELELIEDVFRSGEAVFSAPQPVPGATAVAPGPIGWADYVRVAPYPLTEESEPRMLFLAGAPLTNPERATSYRLGYFDDSATRDTSTVAWSERNYGFAARVQATTAIGQSQTGTFTMSTSTSDAYTIGRAAGREVLASFGPELLRVRATVSGTVASVVIVERGVYGSMPSEVGVGNTLILMYDYAIDSAPLVVQPHPSFGSLGIGVVAQASIVRAQTIGPAGLGPFNGAMDSGTVAVGMQVPLSVFEPYGPGNVRVGGVEPARFDSANWPIADEVVATYPVSNATTFSFTGRNRKRADLWEGYNSGTGLEPGSTVSVAFASRPYPSADVSTYTSHGGFNSTSGALPVMPAGQRLVCASVTITSPTAGSKSWAFYWVKPA